MKNAISSRSRAAVRERNLCQFRFSDGRRCRMLRHPNHLCLCVFHARAEFQALETQRLGAELAQTMSGDFMSATDINFAMGRLYTAVAQERIPIRNANALARIGRLMLATVPTVKQEFPFSYTFDQWNDMLKESEPLSPPQISPPNTSSARPAPVPAGMVTREPALSVTEPEKSRQEINQGSTEGCAIRAGSE